jgi:hypothetical protein
MIILCFKNLVPENSGIEMNLVLKTLGWQLQTDFPVSKAGDLKEETLKTNFYLNFLQ